MKTNKIIVLLVFAMLMAACDSLDVVGMFVSSGPSTEDRVKDWLDYNAQNGYTAFTGVADDYKIYACSDLHIEDTAPRFAAFLEAEKSDNDAIFSIVMGDLGNRSGEKPYQTIWNTIMRSRTMAHTPLEDTCFTLIGNHDIYFDCSGYFKQYFHTSTYYVTVQTVSGAEDIFIFLDSGNATFGARQLEWLRQLLANRDRYRNCIVCTHTSFFRNSYNYSTTPAANLPMDEYYEMLDLMSKNQVDLFMMGHFHHKEYHNIGGVEYVMTDNLNEEVEEPSYLVVRCGNEGVSYQYNTLSLSE